MKDPNQNVLPKTNVTPSWITTIPKSISLDANNIVHFKAIFTAICIKIALIFRAWYQYVLQTISYRCLLNLRV